MAQEKLAGANEWDKVEIYDYFNNRKLATFTKEQELEFAAMWDKDLQKPFMWSIEEGTKIVNLLSDSHLNRFNDVRDQLLAQERKDPSKKMKWEEAFGVAEQYDKTEIYDSGGKKIASFTKEQARAFGKAWNESPDTEISWHLKTSGYRNKIENGVMVIKLGKDDIEQINKLKDELLEKEKSSYLKGVDMKWAEAFTDNGVSVATPTKITKPMAIASPAEAFTDNRVRIPYVATPTKITEPTATAAPAEPTKEMPVVVEPTKPEPMPKLQDKQLLDDGKFGNRTADAVKKFQKENGLEVDGVVGPNTWEKLMEQREKATGKAPQEYPGTLLGMTRDGKVGSVGDNVKLVQESLNEINMSQGKGLSLAESLGKNENFGEIGVKSVAAVGNNIARDMQPNAPTIGTPPQRI